MNEFSRNKKRTLAIVVVVVLLFFLVFIVYLISRPEPTCNDGIQNQREAGIDCGGPCAPCPEVIRASSLEMLESDFVYTEGNKYDVAVKIKNPNNLLGSSNLTIVTKLIGSSGEILSENRDHNFFILPKEEKYFLVYGLETDQIPAGVEVDLEEVTWSKFSQYEEPRLVIINKEYEKSSGGAAWFSQAKGTLINRSGIDFEKINIKIILRSAKGELLAINSQIMNTVRSGEQRDFISSFPRSFSGDVSNMEIQAETNVFSSENFIRLHGSPENWTE
jgi:hypothetical protein